MRTFVDYQGRFQAGKEQSISILPLSFWQFGEVYQFVGDYWGKQCNVSGRLEHITLGRGGYTATILLRGTDNPDLKAWAESCHSSGFPPEGTVHLCPVGCPKLGLSQGGIHGLTVVKEDAAASWALNIQSLPAESPSGVGPLEKELAELARPKGKLAEARGGREKEAETGEDKASIRTGSRSFKGGPLDPTKTVRGILRRAKKRKKKTGKKKRKKERRGGRGSSSSHTSESTDTEGNSSNISIDSQDSGHPFREGHRVRQLARKYPGLLCRHALDEMGRILVQHGGEEDNRILPLYQKYMRQHVLTQGATAGQKRELLTLAAIADRLIARDIHGSLDVVTQRIKAIEMVVGGATWPVAQNLELIPMDQERLAGVAEAQGAVREYRQETKAKRDMGKGKGWWDRDGKGKWTEKGKKGDGKKGTGKWERPPALRTEPTKPSH